jgi:hypothetical protein
MKLDTSVFFEEKVAIKTQVSFKSDKNSGYFTLLYFTLHEDPCTFMIISRWILLGMRNVSDRICIENQNTFYVSIIVSEKKRGIYEITWKNMVQSDRPQMTIWRKLIGYWITKAQTHTHTHSEYIINITLTRQQSLRERPSMLHWYVHCLPYSFSATYNRYYHSCICHVAFLPGC